MDLKHSVHINVLRPSGERDPVLQSGRTSIRSRVLNRLLGNKVGILVLMPGDSVGAIEVREVPEGGAAGG